MQEKEFQFRRKIENGLDDLAKLKEKLEKGVSVITEQGAPEKTALINDGTALHYIQNLQKEYEEKIKNTQLERETHTLKNSALRHGKSVRKISHGFYKFGESLSTPIAAITALASIIPGAVVGTLVGAVCGAFDPNVGVELANLEGHSADRGRHVNIDEGIASGAFGGCFWGICTSVIVSKETVERTSGSICGAIGGVVGAVVATVSIPADVIMHQYNEGKVEEYKSKVTKLEDLKKFLGEKENRQLHDRSSPVRETSREKPTKQSATLDSPVLEQVSNLGGLKK